MFCVQFVFCRGPLPSDYFKESGMSLPVLLINGSTCGACLCDVFSVSVIELIRPTSIEQDSCHVLANATCLMSSC